MLWTLIGFLVLLWIVGLVFKIAGGIIHILLIVAALVLLYKLVTGRNAV